MPDATTLGVRLLRAILQGKVRLEFDVSDSNADLQDAFKDRYESLAGSRPDVGTDGYREVDKFGRQCRFYLRLTDTERAAVGSLGIALIPTAEQYLGNRYNYRFTDPVPAEQIFWPLIELGFRLGDN